MFLQLPAWLRPHQNQCACKKMEKISHTFKKISLTLLLPSREVRRIKNYMYCLLKQEKQCSPYTFSQCIAEVGSNGSCIWALLWVASHSANATLMGGGKWAFSFYLCVTTNEAGFITFTYHTISVDRVKWTSPSNERLKPMWWTTKRLNKKFMRQWSIHNSKAIAKLSTALQSSYINSCSITQIHSYYTRRWSKKMSYIGRVHINKRSYNMQKI